jgi:hypothetical protein
MKQHLYTTLLLATTFLVSTTGCTKKEDAPPTSPPITGSYKLDNRTITCQAVTASGNAAGNGQSGQGPDFVNVTLTTTPEPTDGAEILQLNYSRPNPGAAYQLYTLYFYTKGSLTATWDFSGTSGALTPKSSGGFSGTFTGAARTYGSTPAPYTSITDGIFGF